MALTNQLQQFHEYVLTEEKRYEIENYLQCMAGNSNNTNKNNNNSSAVETSNRMRRMKKEHVRWRRKICEWMYHGEFSFRESIYHFPAMNSMQSQTSHLLLLVLCYLGSHCSC
jgi:hypothetical protein